MGWSFGLSLVIGHWCCPTFSTDVPSLHLMQTRASLSIEKNCSHIIEPSVYYIGLPHAGSTTMATQMNGHPSMSYGSWKEHRFWAGPGSRFDYEREERSVDKYLTEFEVPCEKTVTFDASPFTIFLGQEDAANNCSGCSMSKTRAGDMCTTTNQYRFPRLPPGRAAIEDVKKIVPAHAKFLVMFRDPMDVAMGHFPTGEVEQPCHSCDADSLETWLSVFPKENFLFIDSSVYYEEQQKTMDDVFKFVGVEPYNLSEEMLEPQGRRRAPAKGDDLATRVEFHSNPKHKDCKRRLEVLTGLKFDWKGSD